jgi:hypothetical protein
LILINVFLKKRCVGVFDTVGSLGLPDEITTFFGTKKKKLFGFQDKSLGGHIHHAFHAMALNETRKDFVCIKFTFYAWTSSLRFRKDVAKYEQTPKGKAKGQVLKQVWFAGRIHLFYI